ncbi:MAG: kelch repeat-containing protein [Gemmatimonadaceae bacterium]
MTDIARYLLLPIAIAWVGSPGCGGESGGVQRAVVSASALEPSTPMHTGRAMHTATRLRDGRVLIVGGGSPATGVASAELFDPVTRTFKVLPVSAGRLGHTATLLPDGTVLVVGGGYGAAQTTRTAEIFDPATSAFRVTGAPVVPRTDHAAVLLKNGKVLLAGGDVSGVGATPTERAELYDPASGRFTSTGSMRTARRPYGVTVTADGMVLVAGGTSTGKRIIGDAELYDPSTGTFSAIAGLHHAREKHTAALLRDGRVLIAGGSDGQEAKDLLASSEIFDPRTGQFTAGPTLTVARHKIVSAAMTNGSVLVAGGSELAEIYDAATGRFQRISGAGDTERLYPAVVSLGDGSVMISGGYTRGGAQASTWIFRP